MKTDTEIRALGFRALTRAMGTLEAERFVTLLLREPFDYTDWRRTLWDDEDVESISSAAMALARTRSAPPDVATPAD